MPSFSYLLASLIVGSVGVGYFLYGKKQKRPLTLVCGIALIVFPYFLSNQLLMVGIAVVLALIPYFTKL